MYLKFSYCFIFILKTINRNIIDCVTLSGVSVAANNDYGYNLFQAGILIWKKTSDLLIYSGGVEIEHLPKIS